MSEPSEFCPVGKPDEPNMHCACWYECQPCCRCGDDTIDPGCDCDRCSYARQEEGGYPNGELREAPDLSAPWPSGMCGKKRKCDSCPSDFLCFMKAKAENEDIGSRP